MNNINIEKIVQYELEWYFSYSDADCGEKSNYAAMISTAYGGSVTDNYDNYSDAILNAVHRKTQISKRLTKISREHYRVLQVSFGPELIHPIIIAVLDKYAAAANLRLPQKQLLHLCYNSMNQTQLSNLFTNYNNLLHLPSAKSRQALSPIEKSQLAKIRYQATDDYYSAIQSFYNTRRSND